MKKILPLFLLFWLLTLAFPKLSLADTQPPSFYVKNVSFTNNGGNLSFTVSPSFVPPSTFSTYWVEIQNADNGSIGWQEIDPNTPQYSSCFSSCNISLENIDGTLGLGNYVIKLEYTTPIFGQDKFYYSQEFVMGGGGVNGDGEHVFNETGDTDPSNTPPIINPLNGVTITEGDTYTINDFFSDINPDATGSASATVDYGDGTVSQSLPLDGTNFALNHQYVYFGTYTATVTITDSQGLSNTQTAIVTVKPITPLQGATINKRDTYTETGAIHTDSTSSNWTATVDYGDGTGQNPLNIKPDGDFTVSHQYSAAGTYTVKVAVTRDQNTTETTTATVTVANPVSITTMTAPADVAFHTPTTLVIKFKNFDQSKDTISLHWGEENLNHNPNNNSSFDQVFFEASGSGVFTAKHTYTASGIFGITVTIKNSAGDSATKTITTAVPNFTVTSADPSNSRFTWTGVPQNCSAINSYLYTLPNYTQQSFSYCDTQSGGLGGGSMADGQYQILLSMSGQGAYSQVFDIKNGIFIYEPIINTLSNATTTRGNIYSNSGSFTDANTTATSWTGIVDYGDGSDPQPLAITGQNFSLQHKYETTGVYVETVTIIDNLGGTRTAYTVVTVNPSVITVFGLSQTNSLVGIPYAASDSFNDPDQEATSWTGIVDYGDGSDPQPLTLSPDKTFSLNHVYNDPGNYQLTVNISNNLSEKGSTTTTIFVPASFIASNVSFDPATNILSFTSNADWSTACSRSRCGASKIRIFDADNNFVAYTGVWSPNTCLGNGQCQVVLSYVPDAITTAQFYMQINLFGSLVVGNGRAATFQSQLLPSNIFASAANLTGTVYTDVNKNGFQDPGEVGYAGTTVSLDTGQSTTTDSNGNYSFSNISQGSYTETLTLPNGYTATTTNPVTVPLASDTTENFGIFPNPPSVGPITLTPNPVKISTSFTSAATFTDPVTNYTDTASWNWGDGNTTNGTVTESNGSGSVSGSHTYTALGSYTVTLTVTDNVGQSSIVQSVIAVTPTGGLQGGNLSGKNYSGADLSGLNISGANLSSGTFNDVNFSSANLSGANGSHGSYTASNFTSANLSGANFSNADFSGSNLTNAIFTGANVSHANFTNANLTGATFTGAAKTGIIYSNTLCPNGSNSNTHNNSCVGQGGGI